MGNGLQSRPVTIGGGPGLSLRFVQPRQFTIGFRYWHGGKAVFEIGPGLAPQSVVAAEAAESEQEHRISGMVFIKPFRKGQLPGGVCSVGQAIEAYDSAVVLFL